MTIAALALFAAALIAVAGCKTSGMAVTTRGQLLKINIKHPIDLPDQGEDNIDIVLGNRGVNSVRDVLVDVEMPPQLVVLDETHERGVTMTHDPGSSSYHYTLGNLQVAEDSTIHYKVRASFASMVRQRQRQSDGVAARSSRRQAGRDGRDQDLGSE